MGYKIASIEADVACLNQGADPVEGLDKDQIITTFAIAPSSLTHHRILSA